MSNPKHIALLQQGEAVTIPADIAEAMTQTGETPQSYRDALLMCLLLEHGLRVSEAALLTRKSFDMKAGKFTFYRPKVNRTQTHEMTPATRQAAKAYLPNAPEAGTIWRRSYKGTGKLSSQMSEVSATRALTKRVELLGRVHDLAGLSAHDARHFAATNEARNGTSIDRIVDMFGWKGYAMAARYIEAEKIANAGTAKIRKE